SRLYVLLSTPISTLSLHDALPIYRIGDCRLHQQDFLVFLGDWQHGQTDWTGCRADGDVDLVVRISCGQERLAHVWFALVVLLDRSEEHTSELQSHLNLVCRLLLEK